MKLILLGYKDAAGVGGEVIASDVTDAKRNEIFTDAKTRHVFPKGYARLDLFVIEAPADTAIFIGEEAAKSAQSGFAAREAEANRLRLKAQQETKAVANLAAASKLLAAAAHKRNVAIAAVASLNDKLVGVPEANKAPLLEKVAKARTEADTVTKDFNEVLTSVNALKNKKSTPEEVKAALVALGIEKPTNPQA